MMKNQKPVYALFENADQAVQACDELVVKGTLVCDVSMIVRNEVSKQEVVFGRNECCETVTATSLDPLEDERPIGAAPLPPVVPAPEEFPDCPTPFGDTPKTPGVANHLCASQPQPAPKLVDYLTGHLVEHGFEPEMAQKVEAKVNSGSVLVRMNLPSGMVEATQALEIIQRHRGYELDKRSLT